MGKTMNTTEIGDEFEKRVFNALSIFINTEESYLNGQRSVLIHKYKSTKEENGYIRDIDVDIMIKTYKTEEDKEKSNMTNL